MNDRGTIDTAGFREDLKSISQNDYPQLQLLRLPLNAGAGVIVPIPLLLAGNNLVLTYEALDEQGNYQISAPAPGSIVAGGANVLPQGYARINKLGPWIPLSLFSPLMVGVAANAGTYQGTPLVGGGFTSLQMPIGTLEWQVLGPQQQAGNLLAFFGMNFGLGATIGNGNGSTYAIPSGAGPIERLKQAFCGCP